MVKAIESFEEYEQLINGGKTIVIDFWATWCMPCRMASPIFEGLANDLKDNPNIEFYKVDVDNEHLEEISKATAIKSLPTFMVFKNGTKLDEVVGVKPAGMKELVEKHTPA